MKLPSLMLALALPLVLKAAPLRIARNIPYKPATDKTFNPERNILDIYSPFNPGKPGDVMIFIHGGSWNSGSKDTYEFIGKRFAAKGIVCVVISYRLAPSVQYGEILEDTRKAVEWTYNHIAAYGGDPGRIFISGHSAGAHLAAGLIYLSKMPVNTYLQEKYSLKDSPIRGIILDDAFGLDLYWYLANYHDANFYPTFTDSPEDWKQHSPVYFVKKQSVPFQIFYGGWTYPSIKTGSRQLYDEMVAAGCKVTIRKVCCKRHAWMVIQLYFPWNSLYKSILSFMKEN